MSLIIDYYASLASPWTYFGHDRICKLAEKYGATLNVKPVDFGAIFSATGGLPLSKRSPQRQKYRSQELKRWRTELDLPLVLQPTFFPVPHTAAALMVLAAAKEGLDDLKLAGVFLSALWVDDKNITDGKDLQEAAQAAGFDGQKLLALSAAPALKGTYGEYTKEALDRGVFGAPSYVIGDEILWGQDRLQFVENILKKGQR